MATEKKDYVHVIRYSVKFVATWKFTMQSKEYDWNYVAIY